MKYVIVILAACIAGAFAEMTAEQVAMIVQKKNECTAETGVDRAEVDAVDSGKEFVPSEALNCYAACMMEKLGMANGDGTLNEDISRALMLTYLSPEKVEDVLSKCKDLVGSTPCETGGKIMICFKENNGIASLS